MNHIEATAAIRALGPEIAMTLTEGTREDLSALREKCGPIVAVITTHAEEEDAQRAEEEQLRLAQRQHVKDTACALISAGFANPALSAMRRSA